MKKKKNIIAILLLVGVVSALVILVFRSGPPQEERQEEQKANLLPSQKPEGYVLPPSAESPEHPTEDTGPTAEDHPIAVESREEQGDMPNAQTVIFEALLNQLSSEDARERNRALAEIYRRKHQLSNKQLIKFWDTLREIASDEKDEPRSIADTIWALNGIGLLLKEKGVVTTEEITSQCAFLLDIAENAEVPPVVRRVSISAVGDLEMIEAVPILQKLLSKPENLNFPQIARSGCIALAKLSPDEAKRPVSDILSNTTNASVFGSAAYALGLIGTPDLLPTLTSNRLRLNDNLSVDNAINSMSATVTDILSQPDHPQLESAIRATKSLWQKEKKEVFIPQLLDLVEDERVDVEVRKLTIQRLIEEVHPGPKGHDLLRKIKKRIDKEVFSSEKETIDRRLNAKILEPVRIITNRNNEMPEL